MKKFFVVSAALLSMFTSAFAEEAPETPKAKAEISAGADLVSSYIWRGQRLSTAAFQPGLSLNYKGLSFGAWGSVNINGDDNEFDWFASYKFDKIGLSLGLTDYYGHYDGQASDGTIINTDESGKDFIVRYGTYDRHILEVNAGLDFADFCDKFALTIAANVNLVNDDDHSTYIELGYPASVGSVDLDFALGFTPAEGAYSTGFNIVNLSIKGTKTLEISPKYQLPVFTQIVLNPNKEQCALVFGLSF